MAHIWPCLVYSGFCIVSMQIPLRLCILLVPPNPLATNSCWHSHMVKSHKVQGAEKLRLPAQDDLSNKGSHRAPGLCDGCAIHSPTPKRYLAARHASSQSGKWGNIYQPSCHVNNSPASSLLIGHVTNSPASALLIQASTHYKLLQKV